MFEFSTLAIYPIYGCQSTLTCLIKASGKFFNFHGQPEARLNRDDSVYGHSAHRRTWFIKSISIFLFSAPDIHLDNLQRTCIDGLLRLADWEEGLRTVTDEWQQFIILYVSNKTKHQHNYMSQVLLHLFFFQVHNCVKRQCGLSVNSKCGHQHRSIISISCSNFKLLFHHCQHWQYHNRPYLSSPDSVKKT